MKTATYFFCILFCVIICVNSAVAQTYNGSLWLTSQAEVDAFNYTAITGTLFVGESSPGNITNLQGLSELNYIGTGLSIYNNTELQTLDGLANLTTISGTGYAGYLYIDSNPELISIDALSGITSLAGSLRILNSQALVNLNGLSNITSVGDMLDIQYNSKLLNIDGLSKITTVGGQFRIRFCPMKNLDALSNLTSIGGNVIINLNDSLLNINGLSKLSYVGGNMQFLSNKSLREFCGLYNLLSGGGLIGGLSILNNGSQYYQPTFEDIIAGGPCEYNIEAGFEDLVLTITELPVNSGTQNSLNRKIEQAIIKYNNGQLNVALNLLNAFIEQVNELIMYNVITQQEGDVLIGNANDLINAINLQMLKFNASENGTLEVNNYMLEQNYPNPFNPSTSINYQLAEQGYVSLIVYDLLGREVSTLVNEEKPAGFYEVDFNAVNLPSGVYLYRIQAGDYVAVKKMILIK